MSRDNDRDLSDDLNGPYALAACVDCGAAMMTDYDPAGALCDDCARDRHTSALEIRLLAKAFLKADLTRVKDVA